MVGGGAGALDSGYSMTDARARGRGAASAIIDKFKTALKLNWMDMRQVFDRLDEDGSGLLDRTEFSRVASVVGGLTSSDAHTLFTALDANGSGSVDYRELSRVVDPGTLAAQNKHALRKDIQRTHSRVLGMIELEMGDGDSVVEQIRHALYRERARVVDLFREWDEDSSGTVDRREFFVAMALLGLTVTRGQSNELFDSLDLNGNGSIDFKE